MVSAFHEEVRLRQRHLDAQRRELETELSRVTKKLDGLLDAIADGLRTQGLKTKLEGVESRKHELELMLDESPPPMPEFHLNLPELYLRQVISLHDSLGDPTIKDEALAVLRNLVERVVVSPLPDGFQVELVGAIANMLSLPDQGPELDGYRSSVKVVAGAGSEPAAFRS